MAATVTDGGATDVIAYLAARDGGQVDRVVDLVGRRGATVLALDSLAIADCTRLALPWSTMDDWLTAHTRVEMLRKSHELAHTWYLDEAEALTIDGICLPSLDHYQISRFFFLHLLQLELWKALETAGVERLHHFRSARFDGDDNYGLPDSIGAYWSWAKSDTLRSEPLELPEGPSQARLIGRRLLEKAIRYSHSALRGDVRRPLTSRRADAIVIAATEGESFRFTSVKKQAEEAHPRVAAVLIEPDWPTAWRRGRLWGTPVFPGPRATVGAPPAGFAAAVERLASLENRPSTAAMASCRPFFDHFVEHRWPWILANIDAWVPIWEAAPPRLVLCSACPDARPQFPAIAAHRLGIPVAHLPHAANDVGEGVVSENRLYSYELHRKAFEDTGVPTHSLLRAAGLVPTHSYAPSSVPRIGDEKATIGLVLVDPIGLPEARLPLTTPYVYHREQLQALCSLTVPAAAQQLGVRLLVKPHPNFPDQALLDVASSAAPGLEVLDPGVDLFTLLDRVDFAVSLNYIGSAMVHILRAGLPTILYWTAPTLHERTPNPHPELFRDAGEVVTTEAQLWATIMRLATEPEYSTGLSARSAGYAARELSDDDAPSLVAVLRRLVAEPT